MHVGVINAWRGDPEIVPSGLPERSAVIEPVHDIELFSAEVSRSLELGGGGKEDDGPPLLRPQISFLIVVLSLLIAGQYGIYLLW